uniref:Uncharacterized protein n=1 Tax=Fagus sylvatica TaxID=28930 RepID=A0A2N9ELG6_FAGSY
MRFSHGSSGGGSEGVFVVVATGIGSRIWRGGDGLGSGVATVREPSGSGGGGSEGVFVVVATGIGVGSGVAAAARERRK